MTIEIQIPIRCSTVKKVHKYFPYVFIMMWGASAFVISIWLYVINNVDIALPVSQNSFLNFGAFVFVILGWVIDTFFALIIVLIVCDEILKRIPKFKCIPDEVNQP